MQNAAGMSLRQLAALTLVLLCILFPTLEATKQAKKAKVKLGAGPLPVEWNEGMGKEISKRHFFWINLHSMSLLVLILFLNVSFWEMIF